MQRAEGRRPRTPSSPASPQDSLLSFAAAGVGGPLSKSPPAHFHFTRWVRSAMTSRGRRLSFQPRSCKPDGDSCTALSVWGAVSSVPRRRGLPSSLSDRSGLQRLVKAPPASFPPSCVERTLSGAATNRHLRACCRSEAGPGPTLAPFFWGAGSCFEVRMPVGFGFPHPQSRACS